MQLPKISVVVPSLNQGRFLSQALESVVSQAYPSLELIVMDGGSTDESVDVIRRYEPHIRHWQSEPDGGQAAAINAGVGMATGDLVCWLNADDMYCDGALWTVAKAATAQPGCGLYIGNGFRLVEATKAMVPFSRHSLGFDRVALRIGLDYILQQATFFSRAAWIDVGGLDPTLNFVLDWDVIIRVSDRFPVTLINEFLAVIREHVDTKTASGGLRRVAEIAEFSRRYAGEGMTPGAAAYLFETLRVGWSATFSPNMLAALGQMEIEARRAILALAGDAAGFPYNVEPQDHVYLPLPGREPRAPVRRPEGAPLRISVVTPSFNQAAYLERTLRSVLAQNYPNAELIVMDGGSTDGSVEILRSLAPQLSHWESATDRGPAQAINKGFAKAAGEILGWLNSDDMLADDALWAVSRAFAEDPDLDMVFGNAMFVDSDDNPAIVSLAQELTSVYVGSLPEPSRTLTYWSHVHGIPQPTVFFRRRLLERHGPLDEEFKFIFDVELFSRFATGAKIRKIEKVLAFYRIHEAAKTASWQKFRVELYRFTRPRWPGLFTRGFGSLLRSFTRDVAQSIWDGRKKGLFVHATRLIISAMAVTRLGNPEVLLDLVNERRARQYSTFLQKAPRKVPRTIRWPNAGRAGAKYKALFSGTFLPRSPGLSGGEIRDFHILQELNRYCDLSFVALHAWKSDGRADPLSDALSEVNSPETMANDHPELVETSNLRKMQKPRKRLEDWLRRRDLPVIGPRHHRDPYIHLAQAIAYAQGYVNRRLAGRSFDFMFVSPQTNPIGLLLNGQEGDRTRFILCTYDVESVRTRQRRDALSGVRWLGAHLENKRAERFEERNLRGFDGIVAVSELDRSIFIDTYGIEAERVLSLENGVDTEAFAFRQRKADTAPRVLFTGNFGYSPNHDAAVRLIRRIMPRVWQELPEAQAWVVGSGIDNRLARLADGKRVFVTGPVESVHPYFEDAAVFCAPLNSGSGTKYKILEALSSGVPIVCTETAATGFAVERDKQLVVADGDSSIAEQIVRLVRNPDAATAMARAGRRLVETSYDWRCILPKLEPWLERVQQLPKISFRT